jgi:6-phosphofructo-2-kinase/fructose-2,6-biphosphatase 2
VLKYERRSGIQEDHSASFFSQDNAEGTLSRDRLAEDSLEMLIRWLKDGGNVGIHGMAALVVSYVYLFCQPDATNSTRVRRAKLEARVAKEPGMMLIFLESICDDPAVIAANVALKVSSGDPDYKDISPETAKADFLRRIQEYEKVYQTITEPHLSYLRITNVGRQVTVSRINGYLSSRIAFYLMNLHLKPRSIFFSRVIFTCTFFFFKELTTFTQHGESQYNVEGKIGGDSLLSSQGMEYAKALPALIKDNIGDQPLTARPFLHQCRPVLNEHRCGLLL